MCVKESDLFATGDGKDGSKAVSSIDGAVDGLEGLRAAFFWLEDDIRIGCAGVRGTGRAVPFRLNKGIAGAVEAAGPPSVLGGVVSCIP